MKDFENEKQLKDLKLTEDDINAADQVFVLSWLKSKKESQSGKSGILRFYSVKHKSRR